MRIFSIILMCSLLWSCDKDTDQRMTAQTKTLDKIIALLNEPSKNYVMVASHRGNWQKFPENTIPAIKSAISAGAEIVEIDVRMTKDGELVVLHDSNLQRTTNGTGKVADKELSFIQSLQTKDKSGKLTNIRIPTLKEVMLAVKDKAIIFIDKGEKHWPEILRVLTDTGTLGQAMFIENYELSDAKIKMGNTLFEGAHYISRLRQSDTDSPKLFEDFSDGADALGFEFRFDNTSSEIFSWIPKAKEKGKHVWMTTLNPAMTAGHDDTLALVNPDSSWGWCVQNGATIILTDYPERLTGYLFSTGLR